MSGRKILDCTPNIVIKAGEMPRNYLIIGNKNDRREIYDP
jgi:hypothetical protein